jgi:hypothetical protein
MTHNRPVQPVGEPSLPREHIGFAFLKAPCASLHA